MLKKIQGIARCHKDAQRVVEGTKSVCGDVVFLTVTTIEADSAQICSKQMRGKGRRCRPKFSGAAGIRRGQSEEKSDERMRCSLRAFGRRPREKQTDSSPRCRFVPTGSP